MPAKKHRDQSARPEHSHYFVRNIPDEHRENWEAAATRAGLSLRSWIVTRLNQVAVEELG
jgi:predicted HicB family RNase H-like nuclease